jgi:hypothetical protein
MRKLSIILASVFTLVLASCNDYGKKVTIDDSMEVYMKGDSVNENQAKKIGNYLVKLWSDSKQKKSLQLSKDSGMYVVKMVVDEAKLKQDSTVDMSFMALKTLLEAEVFNNKQIKFVLTDNTFKEIKAY